VTCAAGCQDGTEQSSSKLSDCTDTDHWQVSGIIGGAAWLLEAGVPRGARAVREICSKLNLRTAAPRVLLRFEMMKRMRHDSNALGRKLGAFVCLVAVIFLWAPLWASALQAAGMACCDGAMCPLHGHSPKKSSGDTDSAKNAPMAGCEHHGRKAAMDCTMACCHPADPVVTGAVVFVLPGAVAISAPLFIGPPRPDFSSSASSFVFDPASPPPRTLLLSL
jgi:hypothetical protein